MGDIANVPISVPKNRDEQLMLSEIILSMGSEIESLESKLSKYQQIKQGMMQELLTGKTRLL